MIIALFRQRAHRYNVATLGVGRWAVRPLPETIRRVQWLVTLRSSESSDLRLERGWRLELGRRPSAALLYSTLREEKRAGTRMSADEPSVHTGTNILTRLEKVVASPNIPRNCDYARQVCDTFTPRVSLTSC